jgi:hypothetical protein
VSPASHHAFPLLQEVDPRLTTARLATDSPLLAGGRERIDGHQGAGGRNGRRSPSGCLPRALP